jgi:hypothetical protein
VNWNNTDATILLLVGFGLSIILRVPSHIFLNGILAVQIISHIPLNNVNLPPILLVFMKHLNMVVNFKTEDPYESIGIKYTETPQFN